MTIDISLFQEVPLFAELAGSERSIVRPGGDSADPPETSPMAPSLGNGGGAPSLFNLAGAVEESFPRGTVIQRAHKLARFIGIVREGVVKESQVTPEGKEVILALHGPGDLFGETAQWNGDEAPATATAMSATRVLMVPREDWVRLVESNPPLQRALDALLARRVKEAWKLVRLLSRYTTEARLKSALLILAERWGQARDDGAIEIALDLTHRTLADLAGASREKVTRALGVLQQKGLLQVDHRRLVVPSLDRLHAE